MKYKNDRVDYLLSFVGVFQPLLVLIQVILGKGGFVDVETASLYRVVFSAVPIIIAFYFFTKRNVKLTISAYLIITLLIIISIVISSSNLEYIKLQGFSVLILTLIPVFLSVSSIRNIKIFKEVMLKTSFLVAISSVIYLFIFYSKNLSGGLHEYNMAAGYSILFPTLVFFNQRKYSFTILGFILSLEILLIGSRGSLVVALVYFIGLHLIGGSKSLLKLILFFVSILFFIPQITNFIEVNFVESRSVNLLFSGNITDASGRSHIYNIVWGKILNSPIFGYGIFGDRPLLGGTYSHNIFLEILIDFGFIFGGGLIIISAVIIIKRYLIIDRESKSLFFLLFSFSFIPLLFSGSYLLSFGLALFLGYLNNKFFFEA